MINVDAALTYLEFVAERHRIWERRREGRPGPWTKDPILAAWSFTNVFRVIDYGSQFLVAGLLLEDLSKRETLARCFLYRHTNRPEAWSYAQVKLGRYPRLEDLESGELSRIWHEYKTAGSNVFSGAYMIYPQSATPGSDKIDSIIDLTLRLFTLGGPGDVVEDFLEADTQDERFATLRRNKGVANFMSMQILTDYGYSPHAAGDFEDDFIVLGPGALRGAKAIAPRDDPMKTFNWAVKAVHNHDGSPTIPTANGWVRVTSHMDIQNCLCEFSKYVRYMGRPADATRKSKVFEPKHPGVQPSLVLPKHWL